MRRSLEFSAGAANSAAVVESAMCSDDVPKMDEFFVSQSSAVSRIVSARQALLKDASGGPSPDRSGDNEIRLAELERLLLDVRAGRIPDFWMPAATGRVRLFVTMD